MAAEDLKVDGVSMKTFAKNVTSLAAVLRAPAKRTPNVSLPGRDGAMFTAKTYDVNTIVWNVWLLGLNDDGTVPSAPGGRRRKFLDSIDALNKLFGQAHRTIVITYERYDGTIRENEGHVANVIDWTTVGTNPLGKVSIEIVLHNPIWHETTHTTQNLFPNSFGVQSQTNMLDMTTPPAILSDQPGQLDSNGPQVPKILGNAVNKEMVIDLIGPFSSAKLSLGFVDSVYFRSELYVNQAATSGEVIRLFSKTWEARRIGKTLTTEVPNLIYDPSFEYRTAGTGGIPLPTGGTLLAPYGVSVEWEPLANTNTLQLHNQESSGFSGPRVGSNWWGRATATGAGTFGMKSRFYCGASSALRIKAQLRTGVNARNVNMVIQYFNDSNVQQGSTVTVALGSIGTGAWTAVDSGAQTTAANTTRVVVSFEAQAGVAGDHLYVDDVHARPSASSLSYFDGDSTADSGWVGFPGLSPSKGVSYTTTGMLPWSGVTVAQNQITHKGSSTYFTLPPDNRYIPAAQSQFASGDYGDWTTPLPSQILAEFGGTIGNSTGARLWVRKTWLTA